MMGLQQTWNLENIFQGGSSSLAFEAYLKKLEHDLKIDDDQKPLKDQILEFQRLCDQIDEASSFIGCLLAQNVDDNQAEILQSKIEEYKGILANRSNQLDHTLGKLNNGEFDKLIQDNDLQNIAYPLTERRFWEKQKLNLKNESIINDLSIDGYHSWSQLYSTVIGQEKIKVQRNGIDDSLSWGQAYNRLSSPDRAERKAIFESSNAVWKQHQSLYGQIINHIAGFRLKVYKHRGWDILKEPLFLNRLSEESLNAMWSTIESNKSLFVEYLKSKARRLDLNKLSWYDQDAPIQTLDKTNAMSYDEAAHFIVEQFKQYSPKMAQYAQEAFNRGWIEAEDRGGKRPGGFCTGFPIHKESRIFMTYSGTYESLFTLAHELGHAFHNHVMIDLPGLIRHYPINLAETASTFAEMIISEAAFQRETNEWNRFVLLNAKLQRSIVFFFNIHARFLFETHFYELRKNGAISNEQLCELMVQAQKKAYCEALEEYHPFFWASKMHFNLTDIPFYNFPYTFGYLFSTAIYNKAKTEPSFEDSYISLLVDTGKMTSEELAKKHLKADLTSIIFWQNAIEMHKQDARQYLDLSKSF